jgi:hypothetical protein
MGYVACPANDYPPPYPMVPFSLDRLRFRRARREKAGGLAHNKLGQSKPISHGPGPTALEIGPPVV